MGGKRSGCQQVETSDLFVLPMRPVMHLGDCVSLHTLPQLAAHHLRTAALEVGVETIGRFPACHSHGSVQVGDLLLVLGHVQFALLLEYLGLGVPVKGGGSVKLL